MKFPCAWFPSSRCPTFRCNSNETHCFQFAPPPPVTRCGDATDATSCQNVATASCWWNATESRCRPRPCSTFAAEMCPPERCMNVTGACIDVCPPTIPYMCATGACAANAAACITCATFETQCWDGSCVKSADRCSCPPQRPHRCADLRCVQSQANCSASCVATSERPVLCWDGSCAANSSSCPCPQSSPFRCPGASTCVSDITECSRVCPAVAPVQCWNGACAPSEVGCSCSPQMPLRCPTTLQCVANVSDCPCPSDLRSVRCNMEICAASLDDCPSLVDTACVASSPFRCADGSCKATRGECLCTDDLRRFAVPIITINGAVSDTFDISQWLRVSATLSFWVCGVDRSADVRIEWVATHFESGALVVAPPGLTRQVAGLAAAFPPNWFPRAGVYTLIARAFYSNGLTILTTTASLRISAVEPLPMVRVVGGSRRVCRPSDVLLAVEVSGNNPGPISWQCCTGSGCLDKCSVGIEEQLAGGSRRIHLNGTIPPGEYTFSAFFKGVGAQQVITVITDDTAPAVRIVTEVPQPFFANQILVVYAVVRGKSPSVQWLVNGSVSTALGTGSSVALPPNFLPADATTRLTVRARDAATGDVAAEASIDVHPVAPIRGSCSVTIADGSAVAVAVESRLRISAAFNVPSTVRDAATFRFSRIRIARVSASQAVIDERTETQFLTPFFITASQTTLQAPFFAGAASARATFLAELAVNGVIIANATCEATVAALGDAGVTGEASATAANAFMQDRASAARESAKNGDTFGVVTAAQQAIDGASAVRASANASLAQRARNTSIELIDALLATLPSRNQTLSATERASATQVLDALTTVPGVVSNDTAAGTANSSTAADVLTLLSSVVGSPQAASACARVRNDPRCSSSIGGDAASSQAALNVVARLEPTAAQAAVVSHLAATVAAGTEVGGSVLLRSGNYSVAASSRPASDVANRSVALASTVIALPSDFALPNANEEHTASISIAQTPAGHLWQRQVASANETTLGTLVADFRVLVDGSDAAVSDAPTPIELRLPLEQPINTSTTTASCAFFDRSTGTWSSRGVSLVAVAADRRTIYCHTSHLTPFGGFLTPLAVPPPATPPAATASPGTPAPGSVAPATPAPPGGIPTGSAIPMPSLSDGNSTDGGAPTNEDSETPIIVGAVCGGIVLIAVIAAVIVNKRGSQGDFADKIAEEEKRQQGMMEQPMLQVGAAGGASTARRQNEMLFETYNPHAPPPRAPNATRPVFDDL